MNDDQETPSRLSTFPLDRPFERLVPTAPLSEMALRVVKNFYATNPVVLGTATILTSHLAVTAKHILDDIWDTPAPTGRREVDDHIVGVQLLPGPEYVVWDIISMTADPVADIALLHFGANPGRGENRQHIWRSPSVNPFAPQVGERVAAFGYRHSTIETSPNSIGGNHIELNDEPMMSVGIVREVFDWERDKRMCWPCFQVSARFDGGMSGGPVYDEYGSLCGLVCSNIEGTHLTGEPVSYVTTLWPLFRLMISQDRGEKHPRGIKYPAIELARGRQIAVSNIQRLENWFGAHVAPVVAR